MLGLGPGARRKDRLMRVVVVVVHVGGEGEKKQGAVLLTGFRRTGAVEATTNGCDGGAGMTGFGEGGGCEADERGPVDIGRK